MAPVLPDGTHFLGFRSGPPDVEGIYVGSPEADAANQSRQRRSATGLPAALANGHIFSPRAGTLMAQPFDSRRLEPRGEPVPVTHGIGITVSTSPDSFQCPTTAFSRSDRIRSANLQLPG